MMAHVLHCLSGYGWHLSVSTDLSKKTYDKDTLFFRWGPPINRMFFSVSFNESDKIRIIDPPSVQIQNAFIQAVQVSGILRLSADSPVLALRGAEEREQRSGVLSGQAQGKSMVHL